MPPKVFAPHPQLASVLMHFMAAQLEGESRMPAALSPHLMLCVRGGTSIEAQNGELSRRPRLALNGPYPQARHSFSDPGTLVISVMFKPGLLQETLGMPPGDILSRCVSASDIVEPASVDRLLLAIDQEASIAAQVGLFQDFLLAALNLAPKKRSLGRAFLAAHQHLYMPAIEFALRFGIGERQLERRMRQVFGVALRDVRCIYRFGMTLQRLVSRPPARGELTRIAQDQGYYDQAHMHREFVELSGLGPLQLLDKIGSDDPAYWVYRLAPADYKNLFIPVG
jgi:AraC-like DNA-binding protein